MSQRAWLGGMVAVLLVAAALRLAAWGELPPGLYHDEAYNGLDALDVLEGARPLYFPANNGREPLYIYLVALSVRLFGASPWALRLVSAPIGLLTVAATAAMGRALFSRRVGLLAAAVLAVTLWHVHLSRVGFRAVLLPLLVALVTCQVARGVRTGCRRHWIAAGALYGLSFYTYNAVRFTPIALIALTLYLILLHRRNLQSAICQSAICQSAICQSAICFLLVLAPLVVYGLVHPDVVLGRPGQVSIWNPDIHGGDVWGTLLAHTLRTLGMFFVRGDRIWRHNVPWRPVFDALLGAAFLLGTAEAVRRARRDAAAGFVLIWTAVMALPTLLAEDAPHFLRAVGILPVVALLPALGLDQLLGVQRSGSMAARWLVAGVLAFGLVSTTCAYFVDYANDPMTGYWFERGAALLGGRINRFLGTGWDGAHVLHDTPGDRQAFIDPGLWEEWPQVRFLVAAPEALTVGLQGDSSASEVAAFVWPYGEWRQAWALLPAPAEVTVEEGPLSQGDRDPEPFVTYLSLFGTPPDPAAPALAHFSGGVELLGVSVTPTDGDRLSVRVRWRATAPLDDDYTVFFHYLRDGEMVSQADGRPAGGWYPTTRWRPGDVVNDDRVVHGIDTPLPGRDALRFGLWNPETGNVLYLLDPAGNPSADWITLPVPGGD